MNTFNSLFWILLFVAWTPVSGYTQIEINAYGSRPPRVLMDSDSDTCNCSHLFYLISIKDTIEIKKTLLSNLELNCTQIVRLHTKKKRRFSRIKDSEYHYIVITAFQFAVLSNQLSVVKAMYTKGDRALQEVAFFEDRDTLTRLPGSFHNILNLAKKHFVSPSITNYIQDNGILTSENMEHFNWRFQKIAWEAREDSSLYIEFKSLIREIDSSYLPIDQAILHDALDNNLPFLYNYLINVQRYNIKLVSHWDYTSGGHRRGFFRSGYSTTTHTDSTLHKIIYSDFPTIELMEFGQKMGIIQDQHLDRIANGWKYPFENMNKGMLFRKYYIVQKKSINFDKSGFRYKSILKRMGQIRRKLRKANEFNTS
jgi:hypothetical protein